MYTHIYIHVCIYIYIYTYMTTYSHYSPLVVCCVSIAAAEYVLPLTSTDIFLSPRIMRQQLYILLMPLCIR